MNKPTGIGLVGILGIFTTLRQTVIYSPFSFV